MAENEINKVQVLIRRFLFEVDGIIHDPSACQAWLQSFCKTLQFQDLCKEPNQYALFLLDEARAFNIEQRRKSQMKQVRRALAEDGIKNPTQEQLDEKWLEMYGNEESPQDAPNGNAGVDMSDAGNGAASKSPTSCDTFTADGDTREDSQAKPDGSAITRNETRAHDALGPSANHYGDTREHSRGRYAPPSCSPEDGNLYGDAATREGADVSTTVSRNMRRVPQNEAPAHGFSGGRTAQGTMSRSPEAAAQSGKDYDQEPYRVSTDKPQPEGMTGPSHGGSVASLEARQGQALESQRRAGANAQKCGRTSQSHSATARQRASFRNKEEFIQWAIDDGLDPVDAGECWEATEERGGKDADGNTVKNMKAFARQWCRTRANNRRTA